MSEEDTLDVKDQDIDETGDDPPEEDETDELHLSVSDDSDDESSDKDDDKDDDKKGDDKDSELSKQVADLEARLLNRDTHVKDLNKGIHQLRQELKKTKEPTDETTEFTDTQLKSLLDEHRDDSAAQLQIMKLVAQQAVKGKTSETLDQVEISNTKKELDGFINTAYPELNEDGSEIRTGVNEMKTRLGVEDHPYGDFFATSALVTLHLDSIKKTVFEEGKTEALKEKADKGRKENIKSNVLSMSGDKVSAQKGISSKVFKTAKQIGLNKSQTKIYQNLLNKGKRTVVVED